MLGKFSTGVTNVTFVEGHEWDIEVTLTRVVGSTTHNTSMDAPEKKPRQKKKQVMGDS